MSQIKTVDGILVVDKPLKNQDDTTVHREILPPVTKSVSICDIYRRSLRESSQVVDFVTYFATQKYSWHVTYVHLQIANDPFSNQPERKPS